MRKKLLLLASISLALGMGIAVSAHLSSVREARADGKVVYCKMDKSWWKADDAAVGAHYWKSSDSSQTTSWPGVRMTPVATDTDVWKTTIPTGYDRVIFTRVNGSGDVEYFSAKTDDLTIPTDDKNLYTITTSSGTWDPSKVAGSWSAYEEPEPEHDYYYSLNGAAAVKMTPYSATEVKSATLSFSKDDELTFLKDSGAYLVSPKEDGAITKVELVDNKLVFTQDYTGELYLDFTVNELWAGQFTPGYYLAGSHSGWNAKHATPASLEGGVGPAYVVAGITLANDDKVQFIQAPSEGNSFLWKAVDAAKLTIGTGVDAEKDGDDLKINEGNTFDIYYDPTAGWYSIELSTPPEPSHDYYYSLNGAAFVKMDEHSATEVKSADMSFDKGDVLTFKKDDDAYVVAPKEDADLTKVYASGNTLVFAEDYTGSIYLDFTVDKLWAGQFTAGYYLAGSPSGWNTKLGDAASLEGGTGPAYVVSGITLAANDEVQFIEAPASGTTISWKAVDSEKLHIGEDVNAEKHDDNLKIKTGGTFDIYYDPISEWYSIELTTPIEHTYTVQVGSTSYELELNHDTEYKIKDHETVNLVAGTSVAVYKDGNPDTTFVRKVIGNNNVGADGKILATVDAQIYVDLAEKHFYVGGLAYGGYHLLVNNVYVHMTHNEDPLDPSFREYYSELVSFHEDDVVRFIDTTAEEGTGYASIFDISTINPSSKEGAFEYDSVSGHLVALMDCDVSVYLKLKMGEDEVFFSDVSPELAAARDFAIDFNSKIGGECVVNPVTHEVETDVEQLAIEWQKQKTNFEALDAEKVQPILKNATKYHTVNEIAQMIERYEYVAGKYTTQLGEDYNFLNKTIPATAYNGGFVTNTADNATLLIVILSIAAVSMASISILVIKKRRHIK